MTTTVHNKEKKTVYFFINYYYHSSNEWRQHVVGCDSDITFIDLMDKFKNVIGIGYNGPIKYLTYARGNNEYNNNVVVNDEESLAIAGEAAFDKHAGVAVFGQS